MIDPREPWTPEQIKEVWPVLVFLPERTVLRPAQVP